MKYKFILTIVMSLLLGGCTLLNQPDTGRVGSETPGAETPVTETPGSPPAEEKPTSSKLDLSNQRLKKIPDNVFSFTNLEKLDVSGNQLTGAIQAEIRQLKNLKILDLSNNLLTGVPAEIGQLNNLETLNLANNRLTGLPYELGNLKNLKTLNLSGNNYSTLDLGIIVKGLPADVKIIK